MAPTQLMLHSREPLTGGRMILGLTGWMNGGEVSTGTVEYLVSALEAERVGQILPEDFYLYSFPGSMEVTAMFRPHTRIEDGLITSYVPPSNTFYASRKANLVLFEGKEPNFHWGDYADCLFTVASELGAERIYFIGSVAGVVPHTREPRLFSSVSDEALKGELESYGVRFSGYEGPASVATYLTVAARERGIGMATLVGEIPAYVQGRNPRCIEVMVRHLAAMLGLHVPLDELRSESDAFEAKLNEIVEDRDQLAQLITKLESDYDSEVFDTQMGDLKAWLEQQGIRLD